MTKKCWIQDGIAIPRQPLTHRRGLYQRREKPVEYTDTELRMHDTNYVKALANDNIWFNYHQKTK